MICRHDRTDAMFERFVVLRSATKLAQELIRDGVTSKHGKPVDKGFLYKLFRNRLYIGEAVHKGTSYPGEHEAIIGKQLWEKVQGILQVSPRTRAGRTRAQTPALLKGLLFGPTGLAMSPTHTRKRGRLYRYYISTAVIRSGAGACPIGRIPAATVEGIVIDQMRALIQTPEIIVATHQAARKASLSITEAEVRTAFVSFDELWDELFPAEQARIVNLLVDRIDVRADGLEVHLKVKGLTSLITELRSDAPGMAA